MKLTSRCSRVNNLRNDKNDHQLTTTTKKERKRKRWRDLWRHKLRNNREEESETDHTLCFRHAGNDDANFKTVPDWESSLISDFRRRCMHLIRYTPPPPPPHPPPPYPPAFLCCSAVQQRCVCVLLRKIARGVDTSGRRCQAMFWSLSAQTKHYVHKYTKG